MREFTLIELMYLMRSELFALHARVAGTLALLPEGSDKRRVALNNLRNIRRVSARRVHAPD